MHKSRRLTKVILIWYYHSLHNHNFLSIFCFYSIDTLAKLPVLCHTQQKKSFILCLKLILDTMRKAQDKSFCIFCINRSFKSETNNQIRSTFFESYFKNVEIVCLRWWVHSYNDEILPFKVKFFPVDNCEKKKIKCQKFISHQLRK